jgi:hypothetical protein
MRKRMTIRIETQTVVLLGASGGNTCWCPACQSEIELQDGNVSCPGTGRTAIESSENSARTDEVNCVVGTDGTSHICVRSLLAYLRRQRGV